MKKESYEAVTRVSGSYEAVRRGMDLLLEKRVPFLVKGALLPQNNTEVEEFKSWAFTIPWKKSITQYWTSWTRSHSTSDWQLIASCPNASPGGRGTRNGSKPDERT